MRETDVLARLGGDELAVLLSACRRASRRGWWRASSSRPFAATGRASRRRICGHREHRAGADLELRHADRGGPDGRGRHRGLRGEVRRARPLRDLARVPRGSLRRSSRQPAERSPPRPPGASASIQSRRCRRGRAAGAHAEAGSRASEQCRPLGARAGPTGLGAPPLPGWRSAPWNRIAELVASRAESGPAQQHVLARVVELVAHLAHRAAVDRQVDPRANRAPEPDLVAAARGARGPATGSSPRLPAAGSRDSPPSCQALGVRGLLERDRLDRGPLGGRERPARARLAGELLHDAAGRYRRSGPGAEPEVVDHRGLQALGPLPDLVVVAAPGQPVGRGRTALSRGAAQDEGAVDRAAARGGSDRCPRSPLGERPAAVAGAPAGGAAPTLPSGSASRRKWRTPYGWYSVIRVGPCPAIRWPILSSSASWSRGARLTSR